jgi:UDP-N-acetyl-D-mannosaminuronic acid dehydrogenase
MAEQPNERFVPKTVAIIGGCGHVGLPLGLSIAEAGFPVTLVDTSEERTSIVARGEMPFREEGAAPILKRVLASGLLKVTTDLDAMRDKEIVIITIGTPVDEFLDPMVRGFDRFMRGMLDRMRPGQLMVLRSTLFPGVTDRLRNIVEEENRDIDVAYCPERIAQGYAIEELRKLPQIISGGSPRAIRRARALFEPLCKEVIELPPVEAELAKLFSNAYRYINFAISNQFYMIAQRFNADFRRIHAAVTHEYPRMRGFAGAGFAAGPCLHKDTMQLAAFNHSSFPLGQAAMIVNEGLPSFLVDQLKMTRSLSKERVGVLGMAFKGNNDDPRCSLSYKLRKLLLLECREVLCTDPYIQEPDFLPLDEVLRRSDVVIIGATHNEYRNLKTEKPVVDVFGFVNRVSA